MPKKKHETVRELLRYAYATLAMAHATLYQEENKFIWGVRVRFLRDNHQIGSIKDDERVKMETGTTCSYCGSDESPTTDHLLPKILGGSDNADNMVNACKSCNSSKGGKDLMVWMGGKKEFPPLLILRRYLKIVHNFCLTEGIMDQSVDEARKQDLPFDIDSIPHSTKDHYPKPSDLKLTA